MKGNMEKEIQKITVTLDGTLEPMLTIPVVTAVAKIEPKTKDKLKVPNGFDECFNYSVLASNKNKDYAGIFSREANKEVASYKKVGTAIAHANYLNLCDLVVFIEDMLEDAAIEAHDDAQQLTYMAREDVKTALDNFLGTIGGRLLSELESAKVILDIEPKTKRN